MKLWQKTKDLWETILDAICALPEELITIITVISIIFVVIYGIIMITARIDFYAEKVSIEQLRQDLTKVGCSAAEDAIGMALNTNRTIKINQYWAHNFVFGLAAPNGWDDIELIAIPECQ